MCFTAVAIITCVLLVSLKFQKSVQNQFLYFNKKSNLLAVGVFLLAFPPRFPPLGDGHTAIEHEAEGSLKYFQYDHWFLTQKGSPYRVPN